MWFSVANFVIVSKIAHLTIGYNMDWCSDFLSISPSHSAVHIFIENSYHWMDLQWVSQNKYMGKMSVSVVKRIIMIGQGLLLASSRRKWQTTDCMIQSRMYVCVYLCAWSCGHDIYFSQHVSYSWGFPISNYCGIFVCGSAVFFPSFHYRRNVSSETKKKKKSKSRARDGK